MTKIRWMERDGAYLLLAEGHAGYAPGQDIVCAAISALMQTLYAALDGICHAEVRRECTEGRMLLAAYAGQENEREICALFESILLGLRLIAREYPDYVQFHPIGREGEIYFQTC